MRRLSLLDKWRGGCGLCPVGSVSVIRGWGCLRQLKPAPISAARLHMSACQAVESEGGNGCFKWIIKYPWVLSAAGASTGPFLSFVKWDLGHGRSVARRDAASCSDRSNKERRCCSCGLVMLQFYISASKTFPFWLCECVHASSGLTRLMNISSYVNSDVVIRFLWMTLSFREIEVLFHKRYFVRSIFVWFAICKSRLHTGSRKGERCGRSYWVTVDLRGLKMHLIKE